MKFYRIVQNEQLHSFGNKIGDVPVCGNRLIDCQNESIAAIGGQVIDVTSNASINDKQDYFVFAENLFFTTELLEATLRLIKSKKNNLQFCLKRNTFNERYVLPNSQDTPEYHVLELYFYGGKGELELCSIDQEIFEHSFEFPSQIIRDKVFHMDQCEVFASSIISPFHLLYINLAVNLKRTISLQKRIPKFLRKRFGQSGGKWYYKGLKRINKIGKNCQIHPTALIEGSVIGDKVKIGANSIVRLSNLGSDCFVSDNVTVLNSVLGDKTYIANSNYINSCLTFDEVFLIHGPYQISVFGENSACFAVINCDIRLDQKNIKIPTSQGVLDSNQEFLGIAYGHRSKTGGGNIIAAGRIVPNDLHISPPDNIILNFDKP
ncbi:MAG: hypothetical protein ACPGD5_02835 [Salibacteraceae bacterium]